MSFNGSGTFVINSSGQPVVANTVISATVFNALTADLATGLSTCITKDGQTTPTANIPMGTFKFTNLGNGSAATDSATLGQVQASTTKLVTVSGTDTIAGTMTPALTAYASGQMFYFVAAGANTGAVTLNIDGLGARNVTRHGSVALVAGDILSGEVCVVVYDGTRFQLLNPASYTNLNVTGVLSLAAGTALLPSLAFSGDPNTGLWSPAADTIAASTGGSERLRVDSSGNVGIGTASPAQKLDVTGAGNSVQARFGAVAGRGLTIGTSVVSGTNDAGAVLNAPTSSDGTLIFQTQSVERMRLDSSGNLGIGTASPSQRLEVNGSIAVGGSLGTTPSLNRGVFVQSNTNNDVVGYSLYVNDGANNRRGSMFLDDAAGLWGWDVTSSSGTPAYVWRSAATEQMRLDTNGNLGVGTASPLDRLHVSGAMRQVFPSGFAGSGIVGAIDGVSNGFRVTNTAGNSLSFTMQNGSNATGFDLDNDRNAAIGGGTLATNATNGFLYVPTCAGTPTGTPTAKTGYAPIVVDTTNNKMYFYSGGQWRDAGP